MNKYVDYISELLCVYDCVTIPDFGGFICKHKCSYVDEELGMFCPPSKEVHFNSRLVYDDNLLLNKIVDVENISIQQAQNSLFVFCEDLKAKLHKGQRIYFGELGVFYLDKCLDIIFEATNSTYFSDMLGLHSVKINVNAKVDNVNSLSIVTSNDDRSSQGRSISIFVKGVVAAAVFVGVAYVSSLTFFDGNIDFMNKTVNTANMQPDFTGISLPLDDVMVESTISPDSDYFDYDPLLDL